MAWGGRMATGEGVNALSRERDRLSRQGIEIEDLSDSNPTRHGLGDPAVLEAVARAARGCGLYDPHPRGPLAAREALAAHFGGEAQDYWLTSSTSEAYSWVFAVLTNPGDRVAIPVPGYPLLAPLAQVAAIGTAPYSSFYVHPHGWSIDTESLAGALSGARAAVVVNPGNPTGAYVSDAERGQVIAECAAAGAALIADEVFGPFQLDRVGAAGVHADVAAGAGAADGGGGALAVPSLGGESAVATFTLGGLSKLLAAPQLKVGWIRLSGPRAAVDALAAMLDRVADAFLSVNSPAAMALPELLELAGGAIGRVRDRLQRNLASVRRMFQTPYRVRRCDGGWSVLVDVPRYRDGEDMALCLLRDAHLAVHPGWFYDAADDGLFALSLLAEPLRFDAACGRMRAAIDAMAPSPAPPLGSARGSRSGLGSVGIFDL